MNSKPFAFFVAALAVPVTLLGANSSTVRSSLTNTGVDPDASGTILSVLQTKKSLFSVELAKLAPKQAYSLKVGDVVEGVFTTDSKGRARLRFSTEAEREKPLLDFDPRGKTVAVIDADDTTVLQAVVSGQGEPEGSVVDERADLVPGDGVKGKGNARYVSQKNGRRSLEVNVSGATATGLHLFVNGIDRGEIATRGRSGRITFSSEARKDQLLLDFDPRSAKIDIKGLGNDDPVIFSGTLEAKAKGVNVATRNTKGMLIPSTNVDPDGQAEAKLRTNADASKDFSVELEDVPEGNYTLLVNDIERGTIVVSAGPEGGTKGEIEFTSEEDDNGELPLTFDPVGATLKIVQDTTVYFTGVFQPGSGTTDPAPAPGTAALISEALASTGLDANAKGEAEFSAKANGEKEFEVEIEDVDAGKYDLFVGGVLRGTITAQAGSNGQVKGKLKFEAAATGDDRVRRALRGGGDDRGGDDHGGGGKGDGKDDPAGDDKGGSGGGGGSDDPAGDDKGGSGGGGTDDPAGDDKGGSGGGGSDDPAGDDKGGSGGGDDTNVPRLRLNFDPRGQLIEVKNAAGIYFSHLFGDGSAPVAGGDGTGAAVPGKISVALISSKEDPDATAEANFKRSETGGESFEVELEDLSAGSYELLVGGVLRGTIEVVTTDRGTRGKIEFDDSPIGTEQPLTFDPLGQAIVVQKDGKIYFQRTFPSGS